jgi:hypothetical protein
LKDFSYELKISSKPYWFQNVVSCYTTLMLQFSLLKIFIHVFFSLKTAVFFKKNVFERPFLHHIMQFWFIKNFQKEILRDELCTFQKGICLRKSAQKHAISVL